jgi:hypothetical protein
MDVVASSLECMLFLLMVEGCTAFSEICHKVQLGP